MGSNRHFARYPPLIYSKGPKMDAPPPPPHHPIPGPPPMALAQAHLPGPWPRPNPRACVGMQGYARVCKGLNEDVHARASSCKHVCARSAPSLGPTHGPGPCPTTPPPPGGASILGPFDFFTDRGGWRAKCQYDNIGPTGYCSATLGPILQHLKCIVGRLVVPGPVGDPRWEL